jgi:hypothetical protein
MEERDKGPHPKVREIIESSSILTGFLHEGNTSMDSTADILGKIVAENREDILKHTGDKAYNNMIIDTITNSNTLRILRQNLHPGEIQLMGEVVVLAGYQVGDYTKSALVRTEILKKLIRIKAINYPGLGTLEKTSNLLSALLSVGVMWRKQIDSEEGRLRVFKKFFDSRPDLNS